MDIVTQCPLSGSYSPFCPLYYSRVACVRHVLHGNVNVQKQKKVGEGRISIDYHSPLLLCFFLARKGRKENSLYIGGRTFFCHSIPPGGRFRLWVVWKPSPFFTAIDTNGHTPAKNMCRPLDARWRGVFACHWIQPVATWLSGIATLVRRVSAHLHSLAFVCKRVARTFVKRPATTTFHEFNLSWFVHLLLQSSVWQTGSGQRSNVD